MITPEVSALCKQEVRQYVVEITKADDSAARAKLWMRAENGGLHPVEIEHLATSSPSAPDAAWLVKLTIAKLEKMRA